MSEIPVGETITLDWPQVPDFHYWMLARKNGKPALLAAMLDAHIGAEPGKPPPTGILTVHEGRVGGIPLCTD
jgi:hypothetical protein